ncbi:uncharacterized protein N0V89_010247 [Didymosphaeria variabile]|uniref:AB hydrolase-1 domain-containing protein n=1 Tax=Didymosphaeria variabile TaxID=1932322 RepID=A0A9W9C817_9PLEO|nr:uncharacterized protein N0V89_010247 [Didymosphaeria variabile]KAJ4348868.1 hypothetical protein N0V89_010247 [Didymosphaeria variabile]
MTPGEAVRKLGLLEWQRSRPISRLAANRKADTNEMGAFSGEAYSKWFESMIQLHQKEGIARYFHFIMQVDVTDQLEHITVPTLVIAPKNSMASPVSLNKHIASEIHTSRLVIIDSVGHMVYMDQPQATCDALLQWLQDVKSQRV